MRLGINFVELVQALSRLKSILRTRGLVNDGGGVSWVRERSFLRP